MFAAQHDSSIQRCLEQLLHTTIPDTAWPVATLPLALGLRSASRGRQVSFWSSWADVLHMVRSRHQAVAETMLEGLNSDDPRHSHIQEAIVARSRLQDMVFRPPEWHALANGERLHGFTDPDVLRLATSGDPGRQWFLLDCSSVAAQIPRRSSGGVAFLLLPVLVPHAFCASSVPGAPPPSPLASPSSHQTHLRVWPSSRLFWPPPRGVRQGVLGRRSFALESATARVCREGQLSKFLKHGTSHPCCNSGCDTLGFTVKGRCWQRGSCSGFVVEQRGGHGVDGPPPL